jgi:alkanesulfonate monooxygenase SsuD/methylene tetrahydromethanopterin reductase-like flavin-dependent oxidoreductase (luciferase family)
MKFDIFLLPVVPGTLEDRRRLRPIARNKERVQQMYAEVRDVCQLADKVGIDAFSLTEHHFNSEGFETSVSPLILFAHLSGICPNISFAPLSLVMPTRDPIRAAEEMAILDHLTQGRVYCGLARGYQNRWAQVLGQRYDVQATPMDGSAADQKNRTVFDEMVEVMRLAWTQETFTYDGRFFKAPYPITGVEKWPAASLTAEYGAPGEVDEHGTVKKICVSPAPFQDPHPPMWQAYAASQSTVERCAREGITPFAFATSPESFVQLCNVYRDAAIDAGRQLRLGESMGTVNSVTFGSSYDEAFELGAKTCGLTFYLYFKWFGFLEGMRREGDPEGFPVDFGGPEETFQRLVDSGFALCGTVDDVKKQMEPISRCFNDGKLDWFCWNFFAQGLVPLEEQRRQIEQFAEVMAEFRD